MTPLKLFFTSLLLVSTVLGYSQRNEIAEDTLYGFDENKKSTTIEHATYFVRRKKINDTCWQWDTYNLYGPLIKTEQFIDEKGAAAHGRSIIYDTDGYIASFCTYSHGYPHGTWRIYNDSGRVEQTYNMGVLVSTKNINLKSHKKDPTKDPTIKREEKDAEFPGGVTAWQRYVDRNIKYPKRAYKAEIQGIVSINFIIDTTGNTGDIFPFHSVEYSLDEKAMRIIRNSPRWKPAIQDGKLVKSYKRQAIVFKLTRAFNNF
jgi:periplasmic protein TonB